MALLLADSGATKCEWCLIQNKKRQTVFTQGINPYFLDAAGIKQVITSELLPGLGKVKISELHFYGTGLSNPNNMAVLKKTLKEIFI